jgi:glycogen debranching enzyme
LKHVEDPSERPTHSEYDRYLWLIELLKRAGYDDMSIQHEYPFQIGDVLMSAIFAAACDALRRVSEALGFEDSPELTALTRRFVAGVQNTWDAGLCLALDWDMNAGRAVRVETCAGLSPLLLPEVSPDILAQTVKRMQGPGFAGAEGFAHAVVPSTVPGSPGFVSRSYWRGPAWPVANWLFWWGLLQHGQREAAASLRAANLALLEQPAAEFAEYFEPYTAEPLGSLEQSWTAAVALDWLAENV